jgi:hypothetical protein
LEDVKATLGVSTLGDWYKVSAEDVRGVGGMPINSPDRFLKLYAELYIQIKVWL